MRNGREFAAAAVLLLSVTACAVNPVTGKRELMLISEAQERALGAKTDVEVQAQFGVYPDDELQDLVSDIGKRMAALSERPDLEWTFRVVDDPLVNAFALPGGYIYMTRGILAHFNNEAELASVLGHEIGHVTARHSASQLSQQQLIQAGLVVGAAVAPDYSDWLGLSQAGLGVLFLKFGRDDERQADGLGLRYLDAAGYDPRPMADVFATLARVGAASGAGDVPDWLSTHPQPADREARMQQKIAARQGDYSDRPVRREQYLSLLDGVVYGDDPRQGFFVDGVFHHPEMAFALSFPEGWKTANTREAVAGISAERDAIVRLTLGSEPSAADAVDAFLKKNDVSHGAVRSRTLNGLRTAGVDFTIATGQGTLQGRVVCVEYHEQVFKLLGYTPQDRWSVRGPEIERSLDSFRTLTNRRFLDVQPMRIAVVTPDRTMDAGELARRYDASVDAETLALLNGLDAGELFESGRTYKVVRGGKLPDSAAR